MEFHDNRLLQQKWRKSDYVDEGFKPMCSEGGVNSNTITVLLFTPPLL